MPEEAGSTISRTLANTLSSDQPALPTKCKSDWCCAAVRAGVLVGRALQQLAQRGLEGGDVQRAAQLDPWLREHPPVLEWLRSFFVGRTLGRHQLAPSISPAKSWEGFVGGTVAGSRNVISGNAQRGLAIGDTAATVIGVHEMCRSIAYS